MYVVCLLFYAIGGGLVVIFNRPYMVDRLLRVLRLGEEREFILSIYACFQRSINYIATCGMWRVYGLVMTC